MATIIVRALSPTGDPMRGNGLANFLTDLQACAQIIGTRIKLLQGEWFLQLSDGTPLFQKLLGHPITPAGVALIMRQRILGTPYVTDITSMAVAYDAPGRAFTFVAQVQTQFGPLTVTNQQV